MLGVNIEFFAILGRLLCGIVDFLAIDFTTFHFFVDRILLLLMRLPRRYETDLLIDLITGLFSRWLIENSCLIDKGLNAGSNLLLVLNLHCLRYSVTLNAIIDILQQTTSTIVETWGYLVGHLVSNDFASLLRVPLILILHSCSTDRIVSQIRVPILLDSIFVQISRFSTDSILL